MSGGIPHRCELIRLLAPPLHFLSLSGTHNDDVELEAAAAGDLATGGRVRLLLPGRPPAGAAHSVRSDEPPGDRGDRGDRGEPAGLPEFLLLGDAERHRTQHPHPVAQRQVLQVVHQTVPLHGCDTQEGSEVVLWLSLPPSAPPLSYSPSVSSPSVSMRWPLMLGRPEWENIWMEGRLCRRRRSFMVLL